MLGKTTKLPRISEMDRITKLPFFQKFLNSWALNMEGRDKHKSHKSSTEQTPRRRFPNFCRCQIRLLTGQTRMIGIKKVKTCSNSLSGDAGGNPEALDLKKASTWPPQTWQRHDFFLVDLSHPRIVG